ncbi:PH domain-containing protein [Roseivirga pacifica]
MSQIFENLPVNVAELPELTPTDLQPIDKRYLKVLLIMQSIIFTLLTVGGAAIVYFSPDIEPTLLHFTYACAPTLVLWGLSAALTLKGFKKKKYALRERDLLYTKGLIWSVRTSIPFNRIQHAEVKQGPLDRIFKLHSIKIYTAGGSQSDLSIPGLPEETALRIKEFVLGKTAEDGAIE